VELGTEPTLDVAHLYGTTVLDRNNGRGLAITTVPCAALPDGPPRSVDDIAQGLGLEVLGTFEDITEPALLATLAAMLDESNARDGVVRMDRLLSAQPDAPLVNVDPSLRAFVEHCAFEQIIAVEASLVKPKVLVQMLAGATAICVAAVSVGTGLVLAAAVGVATVVTIAVVGPPAVALGERLAEWVRGKPATELEVQPG
jgi:hypothetical protein